MCFGYAQVIFDILAVFHFSLPTSVRDQFVEIACLRTQCLVEVQIVKKSTTLSNFKESTINVQMRPPECIKPLSSKINLQI